MSRSDQSCTLAALNGRVCLVTGGAEGIGLAITRVLAHHGAHVHVADLSQENLESAAAGLEAAQLSSFVTFHHLDVSDRTAFEACVAQVYATCGRLDILVNNAAFVRWRDVQDMSVEDAERMMRTGYNAVVYGVNAVLPRMRSGGTGHIVTMGSAAGVVFVKGPSAAYAGVKAAVNAYTEVLAGELAGTPVHVMLVRPGTVVGTEFFGRHVPSARIPRIADFLPCATPEQVADAVLAGILSQRRVVDVPGYLPWLYRGYALAPAAVRTLASMGGPAHRDYATLATRPTMTRRRRVRGGSVPRRHSSPNNALVSPPPHPNRRVRLMSAIGTRKVGIAMRHLIVPLDTALQRRSIGRLSVGRGLGLPSLLLTTIGARSGRRRQVPLFHILHRGGYAVVGSNFGLEHHPAWTANLIAHPNATISTGGQQIPIIARLVEGTEREEIWQKTVAAWPGYQTYRDRSGRRLRVFHLHPDAMAFADDDSATAAETVRRPAPEYPSAAAATSGP